jgi:hypothetical protein
MAALEKEPQGAAAEEPRRAEKLKYMRVVVDSNEGHGPTKVNIRIPMQLLRAGVRLTSLIPPAARDEVNRELAKNGVPFDIGQLKPENLDELVSHLDDLTVDVDSAEAKVRVYCE